VFGTMLVVVGTKVSHQHVGVASTCALI